MDALMVDRRPQAGGALFGCLEQVNAVGRRRETGHRQFKRGLSGLRFLFRFFFPRVLDLHPLVFSGVHPPCNVEMKSTLSWSWSL